MFRHHFGGVRNRPHRRLVNLLSAGVFGFCCCRFQFYHAIFAKPLCRFIQDKFFGDPWIVTILVPAKVAPVAEYNCIVGWATPAKAILA